MKKLPTKKQKKHVMNLLEEMDWFFCTKNHERSVYFLKEAKKESCDVAAEIIMQERYNRITVNVYPLFFDHPESEQRMFILHELCHMLIRPVQYEAQQLLDGNFRTQDQINFAVENSTSRVTYLLDLLLIGGRKYMRDAYIKYDRSKLKKSKRKNHMPSKKAAAKPMKKVAAKKK